MDIIIDGDACPVIKNTIKLAKIYKIPVIIVVDTSHHFEDDYSKIFVMDKGNDSVDFKIMAISKKYDIVITQDYGLAAMCLSKKVVVINQNGFEYTEENIDRLLLNRHISKKLRNSGGKCTKIPKRKESDDYKFEETLEKVIKNHILLNKGI